MNIVSVAAPLALGVALQFQLCMAGLGAGDLLFWSICSTVIGTGLYFSWNEQQ